MKKLITDDNKKYFIRVCMVIFADILCICTAFAAALWIRFDLRFANIPVEFMSGYLRIVPIYAVEICILYWIMHLYQSIWRFASIIEAERIIAAYVILAVLLPVENKLLGHAIPMGCVLIGYLMCLSFCIAIRFGYRITRKAIHDRVLDKNDRMAVMLIGAGSAAREVLIDMRFHGDKYAVKAIIDDNRTKQGRYLEGVQIVGGREKILYAAVKYQIDLIVFAIPSATPQQRADILSICKETGCQLKTLPGLTQLIEGEIHVSKLRDVDITDLLGREEIKVDNQEILSEISGKTILVTGGGGSIGSELCRQIAKAEPAQLIIVDVYENNAYAIQQELLRDYSQLDLVVLIGSVRNTARVNAIMETYHPDVIYHAAAHKHVPLMENSPHEAIKNNVFGTYKVAKAAIRYGVKKFLLISTDKAVNPTNIMGASKRICEMLIQMLSREQSGTVFMAVRFGNVLGSNGSVIPLFMDQIRRGGPVTVTDKRITRFFMTIPEAVSLVLQASHYGKGGEIFVLDMGERVSIDEMARNLIKLSGYTPDEDIKIEYTGLRPGEKLYEELLMAEEGMADTSNSRIHIGKPIRMDDSQFANQLLLLEQAANNEKSDIKRVVSEVVPTYKIS
ncbi:MAG: nucleoside-diphosphate sugar epimerase/dehydratase [Eubacteriales bacterium]|nr:nucleoside-diphosphate sugar epimerase/dehydratase [Eubacteriales bacterium]